MKTWVFAAVIFGAVAGYWNFHLYQKTRFLEEFCQPFVAACQQESGCTIAPPGWQSNGKGVFLKESMVYEAQPGSFTLSWHIGTDLYLVASAGKNRKLEIVRVFE
jgi:hypothetical protein